MAATGAKHTPFSLLGSDVTVTGNIDASVDLHVDGAVEGNISCKALAQGPDSRINGRTGGGSITAGALMVEKTARITGDVHYDSITVEQGAQIDGRVTRKREEGGLKLITSDSKA